MNRTKEIIDYLYINKNGLKSDFLKNFTEDEFHSMMITGMLFPCQRESGESSWRITKQAYDFYMLSHPEKQYKHWSTKIVDFFNYWIYYKWNKIEYSENKKKKEEYFKGLN